MSSMMFVIRRLLYHLSLWLGIVLLSFFLFYVIPTDPARVRLGPYAPEAQVKALRRELGLDQPLSIQAVLYVGRAMRLDFGRSFVDDRPVAREVLQRLRTTLVLLGVTGIVTLVYLGLAAFLEVRRYGRWVDAVDFLWVSTPTMFSGIAIAVVSIRWGLVGGGGGEIASLPAFLPPAFALALYPMVVVSRILRTELRRLEGSLFIRTARAIGLPEGWIVGKYMLRNALVPVLAALSNKMPILFTGAFIVEVIFSLPGVGSLLLKALLERDFPMLEGIVILNGGVVVLSHLGADILSAIVDPRLRERYE